MELNLNLVNGLNNSILFKSFWQIQIWIQTSLNFEKFQNQKCLEMWTFWNGYFIKLTPLKILVLKPFFSNSLKKSEKKIEKEKGFQKKK